MTQYVRAPRSLEEEFFARTLGESYLEEIVENQIMGRLFCFTGKLDSMTRNEAWAKVREHMGSIAKSMTIGVDILVAGQIPRSAIISGCVSRKLQKARRLGTQIISEETFLQMLEDVGCRV